MEVLKMKRYVNRSFLQWLAFTIAILSYLPTIQARLLTFHSQVYSLPMRIDVVAKENKKPYFLKHAGSLKIDVPDTCRIEVTTEENIHSGTIVVIVSPGHLTGSGGIIGSSSQDELVAVYAVISNDNVFLKRASISRGPPTAI